ncbi:MAG: iron ABC transporter permease [Desertifilum sp. SIO1I2]|nr:iron ABC transporter permease [Desertifilum sp. SIO1I2]
MKRSWLVIRPAPFPISFRLDRRVPGVLLALGLVLLLGIVMNVGQGEYAISPGDVVKTLLGLEVDNPDYGFVVYTLRLPRTLVAVLVGMGLAIAGTITQGIARNPLAEPSIIGINAGAALGAVTLIVLFPGSPVAVVPIAAFVGALAIAVLIYLLAWQNGSSPVRLILVGVGFNLIAGALTSLMVTFGEINTVSQALVWLTGSVYGRSWDSAIALAPWLIVGSGFALLRARQLNTLNFGDEVAKSLGCAVEWQRALLLLISVAIAGACVATAGLIGFVGLMAPHMGRQLVGTSHEGLLPTSALLGGVIVVFSDWLGRILFAPIELPCGTITAAIGAPYFIYLLIRTRKQ